MMRPRIMNGVQLFFVFSVMLALLILPTTNGKTSRVYAQEFEPSIEAVHVPQPVPSGLVSRQCLTITGDGFVIESDVTLKDPEGTSYLVDEDRTFFISSSEILVWAGVSSGTWQVQVINPGGSASEFIAFDVGGAPNPGVAIDGDLLDRIDNLIESDTTGIYYNDSWDISRDQYKAWIATIAWAEGGLGGYGAHSQSNPGSDLFYHEEVGCRFRFSTGLGPFQLDRGGVDGWDKWPTVRKLGGLDRDEPVKTVLKQHIALFGNGVSLKDFAAPGFPWFALDSESEAAPLWNIVTGTNWENHKDTKREEGDPLALNWNNVRDSLANKANNPAFLYESNVEKQAIGEVNWAITKDMRDIDGNDVTTEIGKPVELVGQLDTWLITSRDSHGVEQFKYFYTYDDSSSIEVWVLDNRNDPINKFKYIFVREFSEDKGDYIARAKPDKINGNFSGVKTLVSPAIVLGQGTLDVFMLVDLTGSFYNDLPFFKTQAPDLMANLQSSYPDIRFGLGKFEDYPISPFGSASYGDKAYERLIDLTPDADAVLSIIAGLYTRSGADGPESQLVALYQAATGEGQVIDGYPQASIPAGQQANFRDGATKLFVLWTDAPFHHPGDPGSISYPGPSFDETVDAILALDPPMVIGISSGGGGLADLEAMAAATGALAPSGGIDTDGDGIVDIPEGEPLVATIGYSGQGIAAAIKSLVEAAAVLPIANAGGPYTGEIGETIVFDGSGSFDPDGSIVLYEWDFESDGVFDFSSVEPMAEYAYPAEFSGIVTLRVTDNGGNLGTDTSPVEVLLPPNLAPVADAGPDQTVCVIPPATTAMVTLDGSGSYDADGDPLTYNWTWDSNTAYGVNPTVELPLGTTTITLVVNDGKVDSEPDTVDITVQIPAIIEFVPDVLNLEAKGKYVTAYIELPLGYDVSQIDISSIRLNDTVPALGKPTEIGDYDNDGLSDLMVKFHRTMVQDVLAAGEDVEVTITGEIDGITFVGSDYIRVIAPAVAHGHSK